MAIVAVVAVVAVVVVVAFDYSWVKIRAGIYFSHVEPPSSPLITRGMTRRLITPINAIN